MISTTLLLGLGGIAGTLIGSATPLLIERQKRAREESRAEDDARRESRQAARIVGTEIQDAISALSTAVDSGSFWEPENAPSRAAWLDHLPRLACDLTDDEYKAVSFAYDRLKREIALSRSEEHGPVEIYRDSLKATQEALQSAKVALARLAAMD